MIEVCVGGTSMLNLLSPQEYVLHIYVLFFSMVHFRGLIMR